jgi:hypothetical protein
VSLGLAIKHVKFGGRYRPLHHPPKKSWRSNTRRRSGGLLANFSDRWARGLSSARLREGASSSVLRGDAAGVAANASRLRSSCSSGAGSAAVARAGTSRIENDLFGKASRRANSDDGLVDANVVGAIHWHRQISLGGEEQRDKRTPYEHKVPDDRHGIVAVR